MPQGGKSYHLIFKKPPLVRGLTLGGHRRLQAALDRRWGEPGAQETARRVGLEAVDRWTRGREPPQPLSEPASPLQEVRDPIVQSVEQETAPAPEGGPLRGRFFIRF